MSDSLQPMNDSMPGLPVHHYLPEFTHSCASSQWCNPVISSSVVPFSSYPQSLPASGSFPMSQLFAWGGQSIGVSASASVLNSFRTDFLSDGLVESLCSPRDSQESSPTSQFQSISSLALSFLYSPTLTLIHDYWKKSYDQPRQHIKMQRNYFANKGLSSQSYGFSSSY